MKEIIKINLLTDNGPVKPVHGVCNGPKSFGGLTDLSRSYKAAGFPFARLHDPEYPHPLTVDLPQIFPNFEADPNDPKNYIFENTDVAIRAILACGTDIIYRLGTSIEHNMVKMYTDVPKDMDKWTDICLHVMAHYIDGWANGMHNAVSYWEIWNEPDLNQADMWKGTPGQYYELYVTASKKIKEAYPHVKVGGPALAGYGHEQFVRGFYEAINKAHAPLDFFSWHLYRFDIAEFKSAMSLMKNYALEYGYPDAEIICDEWNYNPETGFALSNDTPEEETEKIRMFKDMTKAKGAAMYASVMIAFQQGPVDIACYFDSHPTNLFCGIFGRWGEPTTSYQSFVAFDRLYRMGGHTVQTEIADGQGLSCLTVYNESEKHIRILLTRYRGTDGDITLILNDLPQGQWTLKSYRIDDDHLPTEGDTVDLCSNSCSDFLPNDSVMLLDFVCKASKQ